MEIEKTPARPALPSFRRLAKFDQLVAIAWRDAQVPTTSSSRSSPCRCPHDDLELVDHVVEHQHHAAARKPTDIGIAPSRMTLAPLRAAETAAEMPAGPPPTTTTSERSATDLPRRLMKNNLGHLSPLDLYGLCLKRVAFQILVLRMR